MNAVTVDNSPTIPCNNIRWWHDLTLTSASYFQLLVNSRLSYRRHVCSRQFTTQENYNNWKELLHSVELSSAQFTVQGQGHNGRFYFIRTTASVIYDIIIVACNAHCRVPVYQCTRRITSCETPEQSSALNGTVPSVSTWTAARTWVTLNRLTCSGQ